MEDCELCGRQTRDVYVLDVENVELRACASCAKGKKVIRTEVESRQTKGKPHAVPARPKRDEDKVLIENYGHTIKSARERMKIPIKVLAEMMSEKEHLLLRIEEEKTKPTVDLTRKLEKHLKIKLTEDEMETGQHYVNKAGDAPTIGDFIGQR